MRPHRLILSAAIIAAAVLPSRASAQVSSSCDDCRRRIYSSRELDAYDRVARIREQALERADRLREQARERTERARELAFERSDRDRERTLERSLERAQRSREQALERAADARERALRSRFNRVRW